MIAEAKVSFAISAVSTEPKNDHTAWYNHGIHVGFEAVENGINAMLAEEDREAQDLDKKGGFRNGYR